MWNRFYFVKREAKKRDKRYALGDTKYKQGGNYAGRLG